MTPASGYALCKTMLTLVSSHRMSASRTSRSGRCSSRSLFMASVNSAGTYGRHTSAAEQHTLWASLLEAVRGSHQDYTTGSLNRAILLLAVPMVLEMVLESLFAVVDVFWVATPRRKRRSHGRSHRVDAEPGLLRGHGLELVDHRHGRAPHRRKRSRRRGSRGRAGNRSRPDCFASHRRARAACLRRTCCA